MLFVVRLLLTGHHAGFSAKHDWNANEDNYDQHFGDLLLALEEENVCGFITDNELLVTAS
jgi:hypothetical protein